MSRSLRHATGTTANRAFTDFSDDWPHAHPAEAQVARDDALTLPSRFALPGRDENILGEHSSFNRDRTANDFTVESTRCGPFPPSMSRHEHLLQVALTWATAGWPVLPTRPGKVKSRYRSGMTPTTEARQVRRWWERWPDSNIGVLIADVDVVVLDTDGEEGEESLSQLQRDAGAELPLTYEERTGRLEGGRHLFFRLPPGLPALVNQNGNQHSWHRSLDVLFRGHVVVAGSRHHTGRLYRTDAVAIPAPSELVVLPSTIYDRLARHGRVSTGDRARRSKPRSSALERELPRSSGPERELPRQMSQMLDDTSDGRNVRAFRVVVGLLNRGWDEEQIVAAVLNSPLGAKAREVASSNPGGWVQQKVNSARLYGFEPCFNAEAYWRASHSAGLPSHLLRILDCLLVEARLHHGRVSMSYDRIGIGSAMSDPDDHLRTLVTQGWLTIIETPPRGSGLPRTYRLTIPTAIGHEPATSLGPPSSSPPPLLQCSYGGFVRHLPGHDAFRRAKGSLHGHYPLLSLLGDDPLALEALAVPLGVHRDKVSSMATRLVEVGIAILDEDGLRLGLAPEKLHARLNDVAVAAGTHGARAQALRRYREEAAAWAAKRAEYTRQRNEVGSEVWFKEEEKATRAVFEDPANEALVNSWREMGRSLDDLVTYVVDAQARRSNWRGPHRA